MEDNSKALAHRPANTKLSQATIQPLSVPFQTAMVCAVPRDMKRVAEQAVKEAQQMAERFYYEWRVGRDREESTEDSDGDGKRLVEGISIQGAMTLQRCWTNCTCVPEVVGEDARSWLMRATFLDFEAGTAVPRLFRAPKSVRGTRRMKDEDRKLSIAFSQGQSKAVRNAVAHAIPEWLIERCMIEARKAAENAVGRNLQDNKNRALRTAKKLGISQKDLERRRGRALDKWEASDVVSVLALLRTIKDGYVDAKTMFDRPSHSSSPGDQAADDDEPPPPPSTSEISELAQKYIARMLQAESTEDAENVLNWCDDKAEEGKISQKDFGQIVIEYKRVIDRLQSEA